MQRPRPLCHLSPVGFVPERQDMAVAELSGGWRMKLAIARSMMWTPELLLLDEPTNHLDVASVHWLQQYVRDLRGQTTVLLVSHDYEFLGNTLTDGVHMVRARSQRAPPALWICNAADQVVPSPG